VAVPQILLLLYILALRSQSHTGLPHSTWSDFGIRRLRAADLLHALLIFAGVIILVFIMGVVLSLVPAGARELFSRGFRWQLNHARLIPLALLFCLVTGYREELFFRSYLITRFSGFSLPAAAAIGMSTLLFAGGHLYQGITGLAVALIQGLYFAVLFVRLKNIHPLAIAHGLYNLAVLVSTLFTDPGLPIEQ
jgi:membrane protease YdiL (CAAX protease family)